MNPIKYYQSLGWYITSPYGPRTGQFAGFHNGTDLGGKPCGHDVKTPLGGTVRLARTSGMGTWGNTVVVEIAGGLLQLNAHLQEITVSQGDEVSPGDVIGTNGGTNHSGQDYACHIHYEIRKDDGSRQVGYEPWGDPESFDPAEYGVETFLADTPKSEKFEAGDLVVNTLQHRRVNIRATPGGKILDQVEPGGTVEILEDADNGIYRSGYHWWKTGAGWVAEHLFEPVEPEEPDQDDPEGDKEAPGGRDEPGKGDEPGSEPEKETEAPGESEPEPEPEPEEEEERDTCPLVKLFLKKITLYESIVNLFKNKKGES